MGPSQTAAMGGPSKDFTTLLATTFHRNASKEAAYAIAFCLDAVFWMTSRVNDWYGHFLRRRVVPIRREVPSNAITEGYAVVVRTLRLTKLLHNAPYHISCYFFDSKTGQFFGCPYQSADRKAGHNECNIDEDLFFHCPRLDDSVQLVLEIVQTVLSQRGEHQPVTVAWGLLSISGCGETILNYSRVPSGLELHRIKLYPGSPKVLTFNPKSLHESTASGTLECSLYSHPLLIDAVDYFPDFCIVGNRCDIPGLLMNESGPQLATPTQMPHVLSSLDEIALSFGPHAERIEKLVLDDINTDRLYRENHAPSAKSEPMQVLERRLRIGVHNSFTFLFEPLVVHLSTLDEQFRGTHSLRRKGRPMSRSSSDIRSEMNSLFVRSRVSLPKMADDDRLVIVFALDYLLGLRSNDKNILHSQSIIICWGAWQPFSKRAQLQSNGRIQASVSLIGGPRPNPEESLCFKNLLHLYRRDDSIFTESAPKITIQFNFVLEDLASRSYDSLSRSTILTPAPRREIIDVYDSDKEKLSSPKKPESGRNESSDAKDHEDALPPIITKRPTYTTTPKLLEKIDSIIEQESPRQNLPASYVLPMKEARVSNVSRSVYAFLSNVQFPCILDRDGDSPTLIDVSSAILPNRAVEMNDGLGTNEIILQFMALKCLNKRDVIPVRKIFFTLEFYRFQQIATEGLLLSESSTSSNDPNILKRLDANGEEVTDSGSGFTVKFLVDPQRQNESDRDDFITYLSTSSICIEVWDAESLMLLGASYVPLQSLLRNGRDAVQCTVQCPVVFSALPEPVRVTALLYLRLANIGHPSSNQIDLVHSRTTCVVNRRLKGLGEEGPDSYRIRAKPLNPVHDSNLQKFLHAQRLDIQQRYEDIFDEQSYDRIRQWEKLKYGVIPTQQKTTVKKFLFEEELEVYRKLRNQSKASKLLEAVFQGITSRHYIFPTIGEKSFFEYLLQNTYPEPVNCVIEIDVPGLSIVTDMDEWSFYKRANSLETPMEKNLVLQNSGHMEIFLKPMEAVHVPFLYDDLKATKQMDDKITSTKVVFRRWDNSSAISILDLRIEHRPCVVNETYRFFTEAASNCERIIKIRGIAKDRRIGSVLCLDPSAKVLLQHHGLEQELAVTAFAGEPTSVRVLLVLLYGDRYGYRLLSTWRIMIHALQRIDLHSTMGQSVKIPITLKRIPI
ncbi:hypothetical protein RB195_016398 [Necator americanus]|uniref:Nephrocystin-4 n=1 Tax=Necator americanus TaxID=51031 RepID=A0ABR1EBK8_NECAM